MKSILQKYEQRLSRTSTYSLVLNRINANLVKQTSSHNLKYGRSSSLSGNNNVCYASASQDQLIRSDNTRQKQYKP